MGIDEATLALIRKGMSGVKKPQHYDRVYKDECMFSFDTPESPGGLYVNLSTWQAFGAEYVDIDHARTQQKLYIHLQWTRVPKTPEDLSSKAVETKLAIGVDGGFATGDEKIYNVQKTESLVVKPENVRVALPSQDLPEFVSMAIEGVINHQGASMQDQVSTWEDKPKVSRYAASLPVVENPPKVPPHPSEWKCMVCGRTQNLWLNLSDGFIGCGRKQWGIPESGCSGEREGAGIVHFNETGKQYPLAVKLGTITPHSADVYSYANDENDMVEDPQLAEHLRRFGINIMQMEKTEKSLTELQIEMNKTFEFDQITEAGKKLVPVRGPGYVGLKNLGNSCYMNSVMQVLCTLPGLSSFVQNHKAIITSLPRGQDPSADLAIQLSKFLTGVLTDKYSKQAAVIEEAFWTKGKSMGLERKEGVMEDLQSVAPRMFKTLVGKGHSEFSSARQQDAEEYYRHVLEIFGKLEKQLNSKKDRAVDGLDFFSSFNFKLQEKYQAEEGADRVAYLSAEETTLRLPIPLELADNKDEVKEFEQKKRRLDAEGKKDADKKDAVHPRVSYDKCISAWAAKEAVHFRNTKASKSVSFASFPRYLAIQLRRFYVAEDWTPKKMDVLVEMPDHLSLEALRAAAPSSDGAMWPDDAQNGQAAQATAPPTGPVIDEMILMQVVSMGFPENAARRACAATNSANVDACIEWCCSHMDDPDYNLPLPAPSAATPGKPSPPAGKPPVNEDHLSALTSMGFSAQQGTFALRQCGGNVEAAVEWLFSNPDHPCVEEDGPADDVPMGGTTPGAPAGPSTGTGSSQYELVGFVSHMGSNTGCGHYVCHIKKEGRWVIYNDQKVALSEEPPKAHGYLYFYRQV